MEEGMEQGIIKLGSKRLENLIISASADIADAAQIAEQAVALSSVSTELIISAQRKMEDIYILLEDRGK